MKDSLKIGVLGSLSTMVSQDTTIRLGDDPAATVFSTPSMINLMEHAAREALRPHLDEGEESVGVDVQIAHTSATPPRSKVVAQATVTAIEKNVLSFDVVAHDAWSEIGRGTHRRAIIKTRKLVERLAAEKGSVSQHPVISTELPNQFKFLKCVVNGPLLQISLNRPNKRNAINSEMTGEFEQLANWLEQNQLEVRVVVIRGEGDAFCAGDDVSDIPNDDANARELSLRRGALYQHITELPQVFIAAIDGLTLGGGFVLAAACDLRICTVRTKFGLPEVTLGWPPNYGMGIVQSLIGRSHTLELAICGEMIDAHRAKEIGLVNRIVTPNSIEREVQELAERIMSLPGPAVSFAKQLLAPGTSWSDQIASNKFVECLSTEHAKESRNRFQ